MDLHQYLVFFLFLSLSTPTFAQFCTSAADCNGNPQVVSQRACLNGLCDCPAPLAGKHCQALIPYGSSDSLRFQVPTQEYYCQYGWLSSNYSVIFDLPYSDITGVVSGVCDTPYCASEIYSLNFFQTTNFIVNQTSPLGCSGHGKCAQGSGLCSCDLGWEGMLCQNPVCGGRGVRYYSFNNPSCICDPGWRSDYSCTGYSTFNEFPDPDCCARPICASNPSCNNRGYCDLNGTGLCICDSPDLWEGAFCQLPTCGGHGFRDESGNCQCNTGWSPSIIPVPWSVENRTIIGQYNGAPTDCRAWRWSTDAYDNPYKSVHCCDTDSIMAMCGSRDTVEETSGSLFCRNTACISKPWVESHCDCGSDYRGEFCDLPNITCPENQTARLLVSGNNFYPSSSDITVSCGCALGFDGPSCLPCVPQRICLSPWDSCCLDSDIEVDLTFPSQFMCDGALRDHGVLVTADVSGANGELWYQWETGNFSFMNQNNSFFNPPDGKISVLVTDSLGRSGFARGTIFRSPIDSIFKKSSIPCEQFSIGESFLISLNSIFRETLSVNMTDFNVQRFSPLPDFFSESFNPLLRNVLATSPQKITSVRMIQCNQQNFLTIFWQNGTFEITPIETAFLISGVLLNDLGTMEVPSTLVSEYSFYFYSNVTSLLIRVDFEDCSRLVKKFSLDLTQPCPLDYSDIIAHRDHVFLASVCSFSFPPFFSEIPRSPEYLEDLETYRRFHPLRLTLINTTSQTMSVKSVTDMWLNEAYNHKRAFGLFSFLSDRITLIFANGGNSRPGHQLTKTWNFSELMNSPNFVSLGSRGGEGFYEYGTDLNDYFSYFYTPLVERDSVLIWRSREYQYLNFGRSDPLYGHLFEASQQAFIVSNLYDQSISGQSFNLVDQEPFWKVEKFDEETFGVFYHNFVRIYLLKFEEQTALFADQRIVGRFGTFSFIPLLGRSFVQSKEEIFSYEKNRGFDLVASAVLQPQEVVLRYQLENVNSKEKIISSICIQILTPLAPRESLTTQHWEFSQETLPATIISLSQICQFSSQLSLPLLQPSIIPFMNWFQYSLVPKMLSASATILRPKERIESSIYCFFVQDNFLCIPFLFNENDESSSEIPSAFVTGSMGSMSSDSFSPPTSLEIDFSIFWREIYSVLPLIFTDHASQSWVIKIPSLLGKKGILATSSHVFMLIKDPKFSILSEVWILTQFSDNGVFSTIIPSQYESWNSESAHLIGRPFLKLTHYRAFLLASIESLLFVVDEFPSLFAINIFSASIEARIDLSCHLQPPLAMTSWNGLLLLLFPDNLQVFDPVLLLESLSLQARVAHFPFQDFFPIGMIDNYVIGSSASEGLLFLGTYHENALPFQVIVEENFGDFLYTSSTSILSCGFVARSRQILMSNCSHVFLLSVRKTDSNGVNDLPVMTLLLQSESEQQILLAASIYGTYALIEKVNLDSNQLFVFDISTIQMRFNFEGSLLEYRQNAGNYQMELLVDDSFQTVGFPFSLRLESPPLTTVSSLAGQTIAVGVLWNYFVPQGVFVDPNSDPIQYLARQCDGSDLPTWVSFSSSTGQFFGLPGQSDSYINRPSNARAFCFEISAFDTSGSSPTSVTLSVLVDYFPAPTYPLVLPAAGVGIEYSYQIPLDAFTDVDQPSDTLVYQANLLSTPNWLTFDPTSRLLTGIAPQDGTSLLQLKVEDEVGGYIVQTYSLIAAEFPVMVQPISDPNNKIIAVIGEAFTFRVPPNTFFSPKYGSDLKYTFTWNKVGLNKKREQTIWIQLDTSTVTFYGTPLPSDYGLLIIALTATDPLGGFITTSFNITVSFAPLATTSKIDVPNWSIYKFNSFQMPADAFINQNPQGTGLLFYDVKNLLAAQLPDFMDFNQTTLLLSGRPTSSDIGIYLLDFSATDELGVSASIPFKVNVLVNSKPQLLNPLSNIGIGVGRSLKFVMSSDTFLDPDGDELVYTAALKNSKPLPHWLTFNTTSRTLYGKPSTSSIDSTHIKFFQGPFVITVRFTASDGVGSENADMDITIEGDSSLEKAIAILLAVFGPLGFCLGLWLKRHLLWNYCCARRYMKQPLIRPRTSLSVIQLHPNVSDLHKIPHYREGLFTKMEVYLCCGFACCRCGDIRHFWCKKSIHRGEIKGISVACRDPRGPGASVSGLSLLKDCCLFTFTCCRRRLTLPTTPPPQGADYVARSNRRQWWADVRLKDQNRRLLVNMELPPWIWYDRHLHQILIDPAEAKNRVDFDDLYQVTIEGNDQRILARFILTFDDENQVSIQSPSDSNLMSSSVSIPDTSHLIRHSIDEDQ